MPQERVRRRLAAVLALDVVGYSRLMGLDEAGTLAALVEVRMKIVEPTVSGHHGRIVKLMGDGALIEFASAVDAVECAIAIQNGLAARNASVPENKSIQLRIGVNLGDIILQDGDIYGDGVNVAARLESIADPGGVCISGTVFDQVKGKLNAGFEDLGKREVKNISEPVHAYRVIGPSTMPIAPPSEVPAPHAHRPSIAVLPFDDLSGEPDQQYFCDAVSEDLTTALSRFDWLFVAARNAAFRYRGQPVDVKQVGRELGVRYILEGSVRGTGDRARVNVQLIETERQGHIWADRLTAEMSDPFESQDDIVVRIASTTAPELLHAEIARARLLRSEKIGVWDHYLLGYDGFYAVTHEGVERSKAHLRRAIELDPGFAIAYARLGLCHMNAAGRGWERPAKEGFRQALEFTEKAVAIAPASPDALNALGWVLIFIGRAEEAVMVARRAIELNPSFGEAYGMLGNALVLSGDLQAGLEACRKASLSRPRDARGTWLMASLGHAHFFLGEYEKAIDVARMGLRQDPSLYGSLVTLACANARLGRTEEARRYVDQLRREIPRYSLRAVRKNPMFTDPDLVANLLESLRLAGLPEE